MSKLYGWLSGDRGNAQTKASQREIEATLQNSSRQVTVTMTADGRYNVRTGVSTLAGGSRGHGGTVHEGQARRKHLVHPNREHSHRRGGRMVRCSRRG